MSRQVVQTGNFALSRADLILLSLPVLFGVVYLVGTLFFQVQAFAIGLAALACCPVVGDGLFLNPPTEE
jgi:phosphoglycerol transferase MdoB-like AlkP superfamily enzyme